MKLLPSIIGVLLVSCSVVSADTINGRLTVTNATNINPTNAYTITVNSDTRTLTNAVVTPATQILVTTNSVAAMVQRLRVHFSTYKVTGLSLSSDNSTYIQWRAPSGTALTVSLNTNTWAVVSYTTNTTESGTAVRVPFGIEDSDTQDRVSDGLMDWLNEAPTNKLGSGKITWAHSALPVSSAATNFVADFGGNPYRTITATNNIFFVQSTNRPTAATNALALWIIIDPNGTNRTLGFNSSWSFVGVKPTSLVSTNLGLLKLIVNGTGETNVIAEYREEYEVPAAITSLNALTGTSQTFATGTSGSDFAISSASTTHTFNLPTASGSNRGALSSADWTTFNSKVGTSRALTIAGTANEITSSAGAQDLSADRTWTLSLPSAIDLGGKTSFEIPNAAAPTVNVFGQIAGDNNLWDTGRGAVLTYDGTAATALVGVLVSDTPSDGQVPKWNTGGTITWENDAGAGGGISSADIDTSAEIRGIVTDESGTGALLFAGGAIGAATATSPSAEDDDTSVATTEWVQDELKNDAGQYFEFALSDETTAITTGAAKLTWRAPFAFTITAVRASLSTSSSSGNPAVDINDGGGSIFSTTLTIDSGEKTSTTAATPAVISDSAIADDAEVTFDLDTAGTGAKGLKVKIFYTR